LSAPAKPIEFHEEAAAEYAAALDWYFERSPFVAERFVAEVSAAVLTIAQAPERRPESGSGVRHLSLHRFPYAVFYREALFSIQVVAIAHGRRRPGYWKSRI
jgi:toxin ParE1/3/4